jgi:pyruvate dehydrogenase E1 component alpha subunit
MIPEKLYRIVCLIRYAELKIVQVYQQDIMRTPVHLSIGQEAISAGVCAHLRKDDPAFGTHRSHALYLAKGGNLVKFFAELLGRVDGCSGGYGGSMHLVDPQNGLFGTSSIVGGILPIVVGAAVAISPPRISCAFFGDGACDEGIFYESLNFAKLKKLPILFVCENNRYSIYTHESKRRAVKPFRIAKAFGIRSIYVPIENANDALALWKILRKPILKLRRGEGPLFVECETVRAFDHHGVRNDIKNGLRPLQEEYLAERFCPLRMTAKHLRKAVVEEIQKEAKLHVEEAFTLALNSKPLRIKVSYPEGVLYE